MKIKDVTYTTQQVNIKSLLTFEKSVIILNMNIIFKGKGRH